MAGWVLLHGSRTDSTRGAHNPYQGDGMQVQEPGEAVRLVDSAHEVFKLQEQALATKHKQAELQGLLEEARGANSLLNASLKSERADKDRWVGLRKLHPVVMFFAWLIPSVVLRTWVPGDSKNFGPDTPKMDYPITITIFIVGGVITCHSTPWRSVVHRANLHGISPQNFERSGKTSGIEMVIPSITKQPRVTSPAQLVAALMAQQ